MVTKIFYNDSWYYYELYFSNCYICNELGALKSVKDEDFYELIIFADVETSDTEIKALMSQLPRFNKY